MNKITSSEQIVFIVDDDEYVRDSIKELIESINLKGMLFSSAIDFLSYYTRDEPGCLVLDIRMNKMSGIALQNELNKQKIPIPIVIITGHADVKIAVDLMKSGAIDVIQKPYHEQNLLDAINKALLVDDNRRAVKNNKFNYEQSIDILTERQKEILPYLLEGDTSKMIARKLDISHRTVEIHRKNILERLSIKSMSELLLLNSYKKN